MDDRMTAPPTAKKRRTTGTPYMPHELVSKILARLPVESLLRFSCACKAWRSTISGDTSFHREHLRHQKPCLLLSPNTWFNHFEIGRLRKVGLYRWAASQGTDAHLVHATWLPSTDTMHGLAHCDGLVLVATEAKMRRFYPGGLYEGTVRVLNPAMRRVLELPWSPGSVSPSQTPHRLNADFFVGTHQAFGLGRDPRSNTYKVARFFYRSNLASAATDELYYYATKSGECRYTARMEVFTIGVDQQWRETVAKPPYPVTVTTRETATFFKGSLLWVIEQRALMEATPPGFLRFSLEDEKFGLLPLPPRRAGSKLAVTSFAELRGELCVARVHTVVEMWMCSDVENPRWELRHKVIVPKRTAHLYPISMIDDDVVFRDRTPQLLRRFNLQTKTSKDKISMKDLRYHNPSTGTLEYERKGWSPQQNDDDISSEYPLSISSVDVIPYVHSLIPV